MGRGGRGPRRESGGVRGRRRGTGGPRDGAGGQRRARVHAGQGRTRRPRTLTAWSRSRPGSRSSMDAPRSGALPRPRHTRNWAHTQSGLCHSPGPLRARTHRTRPVLTVPTHHPGPRRAHTRPVPTESSRALTAWSHPQAGLRAQTHTQCGPTRGPGPLTPPQSKPTQNQIPLKSLIHSKPRPPHSPCTVPPWRLGSVAVPGVSDTVALLGQVLVTHLGVNPCPLLSPAPFSHHGQRPDPQRIHTGDKHWIVDNDSHLGHSLMDNPWDENMSAPAMGRATESHKIPTFLKKSMDKVMLRGGYSTGRNERV